MGNVVNTITPITRTRRGSSCCCLLLNPRDPTDPRAREAKEIRSHRARPTSLSHKHACTHNNNNNNAEKIEIYIEIKTLQSQRLSAMDSGSCWLAGHCCALIACVLCTTRRRPRHIHTTGSCCCCCWAGDGLTSRKKDITELFLSLNLHRHQQQRRLISEMFYGYYFFFFHQNNKIKSFLGFFTTGAKNNKRPLSKESQSLSVSLYNLTNCLVGAIPRVNMIIRRETPASG